MSHKKHELERFEGYVHRTFNKVDLIYFITALKHIYKKKGGLETVFNTHATRVSLRPAIHNFKHHRIILH